MDLVSEMTFQRGVLARTASCPATATYVQNHLGVLVSRAVARAGVATRAIALCARFVRELPASGAALFLRS